MGDVRLRTGIFVPVYYREDKVRRSIDSLIQTKTENDRYDHTVFIWIGVNGASESLRSYLHDIILQSNKKFKIRTYTPSDNRNIGKPKIVNEMVDRACKEINIDWVVSFDSDIVVNDKDWLLKLVDAYYRYEGALPLGAVCADQVVGNCHILDKDPIAYKAGVYNIVTRAGNEGVAGGVLATPIEVWNKLGGYHAHRIYGSDDGHYALACAQVGMTMGVVREATVTHPTEEDQDYNTWKKKAIQDTLSEEEKKGYKFK